MGYGLVLEMIVDAIMGGWIDFDGKSGRFCHGADLSYSVITSLECWLVAFPEHELCMYILLLIEVIGAIV